MKKDYETHMKDVAESNPVATVRMWFGILTSKYSSSILCHSLHDPHTVCLHPILSPPKFLVFLINYLSVFSLVHSLSSLSSSYTSSPSSGLSCIAACSFVLSLKIIGEDL